ncbi:MAG: hypothetical protein ACLGGX_00525 [Bdellovibrionia bacterium]
MKKFILFLPLFMVLGFNSGCTRSAQETTTVQISLPKISSNKTLAKKSVTALGGSIYPQDISELNCFLVAVGGPEPAMRRNVCGRDPATGGTTMTPEYIGVWAGAFPAGGSSVISLNVPAGKDRKVHLIGFYAPDLSYCKNFKVHGFPGDDNLSKPYRLGSALVDLEAGKTASVSIPYTFDADSWFDGCKGPDFPDDGDGGGSNSGPPVKISLRKDYYPRNAIVAEQCFGIDVSLLDGNNRHTISNTPIAFSINGNGTPQTIYQTYDDCQSSDPSGTTTASYPIASTHSQFYIRAPMAAGTFALHTTSSGLTTEYLNMMVHGYSPMKSSIYLNGPHQALPGVCYPVKLEVRDLNFGLMGSSPRSATVTSNVAGTSLYADPGCTTAATNLSWPSDPSMNFYMKLGSTTEEVIFTFNPTWADSVPVTARVWRGRGTTTPKYFKVNGPNMIGFHSTCGNQSYDIELTNEEGTPVLAPAAIGFHPEIGYSPFGLYTNFLCDTAITDGAPASIPAGQYRYKAYVKPLWGGNHEIVVRSTSGTITRNSNWQQNIYVTDGPEQFLNVNGTSPWTPINVAADTCTPIDFQAVDSYTNVITNLGIGLSPSFSTPEIISNPSNFTFRLFTDAGCTADAYSFSLPDTGTATSAQLYFKAVPPAPPLTVTYPTAMTVRYKSSVGAKAEINLNITGL